MTLPQEPEGSPNRPEVIEIVEETVVVGAPVNPASDDAANPVNPRVRGEVEASPLAGYREWDRSEWLGEGQEPPDRPAGPPLAETEPRWTKWEWIGEGQGAPGPRRGVPAASMPDGENGYGGHRHNPGMAHWGGSRLHREERALPQR